jgi:hypothetical protein
MDEEKGKVMRRLFALSIVACTLMNFACAARSRDYRFGITGVVTAEDGAPLQDVEVILAIYGPVYAGVSPVQTERLQTNITGGFVFMYTSHQRGVKYTVSVQKVGFEPQTVSGSAPPDGHHTIRLRKVGADLLPVF